ncbi:methyltransferase domain-containing protein [Pedobacter psychrodurus]|uniref:Methyltransferase domain-containing protein n=1 Tax=Pedobacter psychrodurus TaxID=2530456 RepID=A0A4R0PIX4_9SPHI|nr:methyltransferase domain-containing protein [Pedobacter psychrodurus]TCD19844.1 methyltransferase domain-containing protein [Pedobacter psychrodurus]
MANLLTDRAFWVNYWESKKGLAVQLPSNYLFHQQLADVIQKNNVKTAIELGGFPGYYAVFLKKYFKLDVTLLDYFVHPPVVNELLEKNGLTEKDIHIIETDLFNYTPEKQYDLVLSCGLIEHFNDTADIINRHIAFVKPGGTLFITLPNFKAVNGWFQKTFDRENYDKHNIDSMDPVLLKSICEQAGLTEVKSGYFGRFSVWLENESQKSAGVRLFKKAVWLTGKVFTKIIPFESKNLSPYIILVAKKI